MKITSSQIEGFRIEGFMILPDFLSSGELAWLRKICDKSIREIECEMLHCGVEKDRINLYGKKYFIQNIWKKMISYNPLFLTTNLLMYVRIR